MVKKNKWLIAFLTLVVCQFSFGQEVNTSYKRKLNNVDDQWHKIVLPLDAFNKISPELSDIRIYGFRSDRDTVEVPFKWQITENKIVTKELDFNLINSSAASDGYFFTFELATLQNIHEIQLSFEQQNYDWRLMLQGSQDLKEWFTVVNNYRILSIKNGITDYQFGKVVFPESKYKYYRFNIRSKEKPVLQKARVLASETSQIALDNRTNTYKVTENKKDKTTLIDIDLASYVPVSEIAIFFDRKVEFYRPFQLKVLRDSTKLASGTWNYHYGSVTSGTVSSLEDNRFLFDKSWTKKLQLVITNHDNVPLKLDSIQVSGPEYALIARFEDKHIPYYLFYGNKKFHTPNYDITHFATPEDVVTLDLGNEETIRVLTLSGTKPLFENKWWLWLMMIVIIGLLGGFTVKMMRGNS